MKFYFHSHFIPFENSPFILRLDFRLCVIHDDINFIKAMIL